MNIDKLARLLLMVATALPCWAGSEVPRPNAQTELYCNPVFAMRHDRDVPPQGARGLDIAHTYYLFSNPDLAIVHLRLLSNLGPLPVKTDDWPRNLEMHLVPVGGSGADEDFGFRVAFRPYPEESDPPLFLGQPMDERTAVIELQGLDDLEGSYRLEVREKITGEECRFEPLLVLGPPEDPLDVVDDHLVRARFFESQGALHRASKEVELALHQVPNSVRAWIHRAALASQSDDKQAQLQALERLRTLTQSGNDLDALSTSKDLDTAREFLKSLPGLREELGLPAREP